LWWWNEEVKEKVKKKQNAYATLSSTTLKEEREVSETKYKAAKQLEKKAITIGKNNAYKRLYQRLDTKDSEKDVFKLAKVREKKTRDLENVRCTKGKDDQVLVEETKIRERWQSYFSKLFNGKRSEYPLRLENGVQEGHQNDRVNRHISKEDVKDALRKMKLKKLVGLGLIPVEI